MNTFRTNSNIRRTAVALFVGALVLGGTFATAAAFNGRGSTGGEDPASPAPSTPVVTPAPVVTPEPTDSPEPIESPEPTDGGAQEVPTVVDLETADGHDVSVDLGEIVHLLDGAESGHPGEGMSVEPYTLQIENLDERTLKLTWVDFGIDNELTLYRFQDGKVLVMVQPEPSGDVDAMGFDRELILTFTEPVSAGDIEGFVQGGLDTPGDDAA
jgi:hypothetical protein